MELRLTVEQQKHLEKQATKRILGYIGLRLFVGFFFADLNRRIGRKAATR